MKHFLGAASCVLALSSAASAGRPDADALDGFDRTGETIDCVNMRGTDIKPVDESTLLFRVGRTYYVNETRSACHDIDSNFTRIDVDMFGARLCSGETLRVVQQQGGVFQGACTLGPFERLAKKAPETLKDE